MPSSQVRGVVSAAAANYARQEPDAQISLEAVTAGAQIAKQFIFRNSGNVNQTLIIIGATSPLNCTVTSLAGTINGVSVSVTSPVVLEPNKELMLIVRAQTDDMAIGSASRDYGFNLEWSWS